MSASTRFWCFSLGLVLAFLNSGCNQARRGTSFVETVVPLPPIDYQGGAETDNHGSEENQFVPARLAVKPTPPPYPPRALAGGIVGLARVAVNVTIDREGRVMQISPSFAALSTFGPYADDFREAVERALREWRFYPAEVRQIELVVAPDGVAYRRAKRVDRVESQLDLVVTFEAR
jgi:outer membrane biosynthesis protein TonB